MFFSDLLNIIFTVLIYIAGLAFTSIIVIPFTFNLYSGKELSRWDFDEVHKFRKLKFKEILLLFFRNTLGLVIIFFITKLFYGHLLSATSLFLLFLLILIYVKYVFSIVGVLFLFTLQGYFSITSIFRSKEQQERNKSLNNTKTEYYDALINLSIILFCISYTLIGLYIFGYFENPIIPKITEYLHKVF